VETSEKKESISGRGVVASAAKRWRSGGGGEGGGIEGKSVGGASRKGRLWWHLKYMV